MIYQTLIEPSTELKLKKHIIPSLEAIISSYSNVSRIRQDAAFSRFVTTLLAEIHNLIENPQTQQNMHILSGLLFVLQAIITGLKNSGEFEARCNDIISCFHKLVEVGIVSARQLFDNLPTNVEELSLDNPQVAAVLSTMDFLKNWSTTVYRTLEKFTTAEYKGFRSFALSDQLCDAIFRLLGVTAVKIQNPQNCLISHTGLEKLDNQLNHIKYKLLESIHTIYSYIYVVAVKTVRKQSPFHQQGNQLSQLLIASLVHYCRLPDLETL